MRKRDENKKIKKIKIKMKTTLGYMESWSRKSLNLINCLYFSQFIE